MLHTAGRDHESGEAKLRELMLADEKARAKHDKLVAELNTTNDELAKIAADKMELLGQLGGLYKKSANGHGKKRGAV